MLLDHSKSAVSRPRKATDNKNSTDFSTILRMEAAGYSLTVTIY
jgi:hypothetical protein